MKEEYPFSYFKCQACTSKVNCEKCAADIREDLLATGLVTSVSLDMNLKVMTLDLDPPAEDDVIDHLEGIGVFM